MKNLARILVSALALWLTTLIVGGPQDRGIWVQSAGSDFWGVAFTFVVLAIILAGVNLTLGKVLKFLSFPLRFITLGLFSLIVNGLILLAAGWVARLLGFGLEVDGFWWAVLGAIVMWVLTTIIGAVLGVSKKK